MKIDYERGVIIGKRRRLVQNDNMFVLPFWERVGYIFECATISIVRWWLRMKNDKSNRS
jgi:hypothetical protein